MKMNLYDSLLNIGGKDIETEIKNSINETKEQLKDLDVDRMCLIYSSYLYENLKKRHVLAHIIDTKDLGLSYQHRFILVYAKEYFLIDLTYAQFCNENALFSHLLKDGYQIIDNNTFIDYLKTFVSVDLKLNLDDAFVKR